jgi:CBS domain-containing membrane protein
MKPNEPVVTLMSSNVTTVSVTQKLSEVRRLMADEELHHVPVVRGPTLVGMLSVIDLVRLSDSAQGSDARAQALSIEQVMKTDLVTLGPDQSVRDAARHLRSGQLHALPIVGKDHELLGIVTSTDLIRYLYDQY